jgi:hypothetical protein
MLGAAIHRERYVRADLLGQHIRGDYRAGIAAREDHEALDVVSELAHVAGPVMRLENGDGIIADAAR